MRRVVTVLVAGAGLTAAGQVPASPDVVADRVLSLTRESVWTPVSATPVRFPTFHPQGLVKVGGVLFVSSVEVRTPTRRFPARVDGFDRDQGSGVAHLFKMDLTGALLGDTTLGEGPIYHPGGIDYDGRSIWVPVAEYRPDSRSILYRVDPETGDYETIEGVAGGHNYWGPFTDMTGWSLRVATLPPAG